MRSNKCAYHRDAKWRLPGDMPDMAPDSGLDSYSRCADLEFHPVYGQKIELRKRGLNDAQQKVFLQAIPNLVP